MYNEDGEAIDRAPNPMMLLTMEVTQPVAVGDMIRKKNKPAKRRSKYECPREWFIKITVFARSNGTFW